jgi:hypothetical protein
VPLVRTKLLNYVLGVQLVVEDDNGNIVEKKQMEPVELFNEDQVLAMMAKVRQSIGDLNNPELNESADNNNTP